MRIFLILLILWISSTAWCLDCSSEDAADRQADTSRINIEAQIIDYAPPMMYAQGNVLLIQGQKRLYADKIAYNLTDGSGLLENAAITTCDRKHMDYHIAASQIRLTTNQRLIARGVGVYLGNVRIIGLPHLNISVAPNTSNQALLPRPGYNRFDGLFATTDYALVVTPDMTTDLRLKITTKQSVQWNIAANRAIKGDLLQSTPFTTDFDSALTKQSILRPIRHNDTYAYVNPKPNQPLLSGFGALTCRERAYDIDEPDLQVSRLPELGLRHLSPQSEITASWSRSTERPNQFTEDRWDARGVFSTTFATIGSSTALRASGLARYSKYGDGSTYRVLGASLDLSRIFADESFASIRLITHSTSGSTPFEFDDIDIKHELQTAGRYVLGRNIYEALLRYDLDENSIRDWQITVGRRMHCLEPSITWHNKFKQIAINIQILGL